MVHLLIIVIYLSFIALGLPDSLLGASWPVMYTEMGVDVSLMGPVGMVISAGTILSSLMSDRLTHALGPGKVTALSVATTALALFGFATCRSYPMLFLWAIPYGLGAGSVDACLNNYVALHYSSRHMSWLHCMWGVGASVGPYVMGLILTAGGHWSRGYQTVGILQVLLTAVILLSLKLWKAPPGSEAGEAPRKAKSMGELLSIPGARQVLITFFCYCAMEGTAGHWASSYLALARGVDPETAASFGALFYLGITLGRGLNGFLTVRFTDTQLIRMGQSVMALGTAVLLLLPGQAPAMAGLVLVGLGCAPVYPCIIHSTPGHFGAENSQALIGVQMACAYMGSCFMPPLFGVLGSAFSLGLLPVFLLALLALMIGMHEKMLRRIHTT